MLENILVCLFMLINNLILRLFINNIYLKLELKVILSDSLIIGLMFLIIGFISDYIKDNVGYTIFIFPIIFIFIPMIYIIFKKKYYIKNKKEIPFYYGLVELFIILFSVLLASFTAEMFI